MTEIKLYNTKTKTKEVFTPLDWQDDTIPEKDKKVRMYVCGPTVYDRAHIGNARPVVVFDTLYRLLRHVYGKDHVTYARNFTDVDDKINTKAEQTGRSIRDITDETIGWFLDDMGALEALVPDEMPRATEYIPQMVAMIEELIAKGHAYAAEGHVLFDVNSYEHYGALSGRSVDDMIAGARVEVAPYKRNPMDFVLWKPSTGIQPGWNSPWGYGRPGWHIECSAMSRALFGETFDIHGGGLDLQFPHHENEIAQSCACCGEDTFAKVWMHNEMLQVEGKKMSKSLGNFFSVRELLDQGYPGEVIRFVFLSTHYSKPMDWTDKKAKEAEATLRKWRRLTDGARPGEVYPWILEKLKNDLNTHGVIADMHQLAKDGSREALKATGLLLGILTDEAVPLKESSEFLSIKKKLETLIQVRGVAKEQRDFQKADEIRNDLLRLGVSIKDSPEGVSFSLELSNRQEAYRSLVNAQRTDNEMDIDYYTNLVDELSDDPMYLEHRLIIGLLALEEKYT